MLPEKLIVETIAYYAPINLATCFMSSLASTWFKQKFGSPCISNFIFNAGSIKCR